MKNLLNYISYVPKQMIVGTMVFVMALSAMVAPAASNSSVFADDANVRLESTTKVMNLNDNTGYQNSVDAKVDQVVQIEVWYHNMENADSGKIANNLRVAMDLPSEQGKNQTVTSTVSADNANTVTSTASINLSLDRAYLEYIPYGAGVGPQDGGAKWRHNKGAKDGRDECLTGNNRIPDHDPNNCYVTESLGTAGDQIINGGMVIEEEYLPSFEFESSITILARVKADAIKVNKYVRNVTQGEEDWQLKNTAKPGETLEYMIRFENMGNTELRNVMVGDNLSPNTSYIEGTTRLINMNSGAVGRDIENDNVTRGGINVGHYMPGSAGYVTFKAKVDPQSGFRLCTTYTLKNVGIAKADGMEPYYNTAHTDVKVVCEDKPEQPEKPEKPEKPGEELPEELPNTGLGGVAAGLMGSGALGVGIRSWLSSRRNLLASLLEG